MDNVEKTVEEILKYCKNNTICDNCIFYFTPNNLTREEESCCGLKNPLNWRGINKDKKEYLLKVKENVKLKEDLQKAKSEVEYYKQIYFGGNVTYGEE